MFRNIVFIAGLLACLPVASVSAAPPRFNGIGSIAAAEADKSDAQAALPVPTPAVTEPAAKDAQPEAKDKTHDKPSSTASAESSNTGKQHSWLWHLFHPHSKDSAPKILRKKPGELINTEKRYKPAYDLLKTADLYQHRPGYDARWHVRSSRVMCRMTQTLPSYGHVEFRQGVDQPLEFAMYVDNPPAGSGLVRVSARPPIWRHYAKPRQLGRLELDNGRRAVIASSDWSRRLMLELSDGMQPVLHFWDAADASDDIEVFISAISFNQNLALFNKCLGQLLNYDFKQVKRTVLHFNPDSSRFRKQTYQEMDGVLETIKADKGIGHINLDIYTVRNGLARYNYRLATRRAQAVRDYMLKHGISENRLFIRIHTKSSTEMKKLGYSDADVYVLLDRTKTK